MILSLLIILLHLIQVILDQIQGLYHIHIIKWIMQPILIKYIILIGSFRLWNLLNSTSKLQVLCVSITHWLYLYKFHHFRVLDNLAGAHLAQHWNLRNVIFVLFGKFIEPLIDFWVLFGQSSAFYHIYLLLNHCFVLLSTKYLVKTSIKCWWYLEQIWLRLNMSSHFEFYIGAVLPSYAGGDARYCLSALSGLYHQKLHDLSEI